jgi:hypothetical protein
VVNAIDSQTRTEPVRNELERNGAGGNGTPSGGTAGGPGRGLSARQDRVATALAAGRTKAAAARECGVGKVTIWRWLKDPAFRERVAEIRRALLDRAIGRLADVIAGARAPASQEEGVGTSAGGD